MARRSLGRTEKFSCDGATEVLGERVIEVKVKRGMGGRSLGRMRGRSLERGG
jgi:hypothetical protein